MDKSPLKNHSLVEIEAVVSKALTEMCGSPVEVKVSSFVGASDVPSSRWHVRMQLDAKATPSDPDDVPF